MIGYLRGKLVMLKPPALMLDVNGVGYEIEAPMSTCAELPAVGQEVALLTHLAIRDDAHSLYGFRTEDERTLFRHLLKVSGVGARVALAILSGVTVEGFVQYIEEEDEASLIRVPGIGKKTAQRLIVEMRDRLKDSGFAAGPTAPGGATAPVDGVRAGSEREAYDALIALGYKPPEAKRMLAKVDGEDLDTAELVRQALRNQNAGKKGSR